MLKHFNETFSGWGGVGTDGKTFGFEGYTFEDAMRKQDQVAEAMRHVRGIRNIKVTIEQISRNRYKVVNKSSYETDR